MKYLNEYKERHGKCEYCIHHNRLYRGCVECYDANFKDKIDLMSYIKQRVNEDASKQFDNSDEGRSLLAIVNETSKPYMDAKEKYDKAKKEFIELELKKIEDILGGSI